MNLRHVFAGGVLTVALLVAPALPQEADTAADARKAPTSAFNLQRAELLATAEDLEGAAAALNEALESGLSPEQERAALNLTTDLAAKKARKSATALRRAEALLDEGDFDGASTALGEVFSANAGYDDKAIALAREIAARRARDETANEKKSLFEAWLKRGENTLANHAARESQSLAARPDKRAAENEKFRVTRDAESALADENLSVVEMLLAAGDHSAAEKRLEEIAKAELTDAQRKKLAALTRRAIPQDLSSHMARVFDRDFLTTTARWIAIVPLMFAMWLTARVSRWIYTRTAWHKRTILGEIEDSSERGLGDLMLGVLSHEKPAAASVSAGLFSVHISVVPRGQIKAPQKLPPPPEVPLDAFDDITGNLASSISRFFVALPRWWRADVPSWSAKAFKVGTETAVILTHRKSRTRVTSLECSCPPDISFAQLYAFAEDVVFTMYYLIENPKTDRSVASVGPNLRFAVDELELYAQAKGQEHLHKALQILQGAQKRAPRSFDAKLFEGITLDILNRHDEAISRFQELKSSDSYDSVFYASNRNAVLLYSEAIAHLRCYNKESLATAEGLIKQCIATTEPAKEELKPRPETLLYNLARAALANVVAHKIILWSDFTGDDKAKARPVVDSWVKEVSETVAKLKAVDLGFYTDHGRRQLEWAIANADGNVHLNYAHAFLARPKLDSADEPKYQEYLSKARNSFVQAERKLPPLVETLTNLATVNLLLRDLIACRNYCDAAIRISPNYEYAFYRKTQSYDVANDSAGAKAVIAATPSITIPSFKKLVEKYA